MTTIRAAAAALALLIGIAGCTDPVGTDVPDGAAALEMRELPAPLAQNFYSDIQERERLVVRDAESWMRFWERLTSRYSPRPAAPAVDFTSEMVVVAAMGSRPSGGHSIHIDEVAEADGRVYVVVREMSPGPECMVTAAITSPLVAVRIPRRAGAVVFIERAGRNRCD